MQFVIKLMLVISTFIISADVKYLLVEIPKDSSPALSHPDVLRQNGKPISRGLKRIYKVQRIYIYNNILLKILDFYLY